MCWKYKFIDFFSELNILNQKVKKGGMCSISMSNQSTKSKLNS